MDDAARIPYKLANLEGGPIGRPAIVVGEKVCDLAEYDRTIARSESGRDVHLPTTTRGIIEQYDTCRLRLGEIAAGLDGARSTPGLHRRRSVPPSDPVSMEHRRSCRQLPGSR